MNKKVFKEYLIERVIPDIKAKWPQCRGKTVFIQLDNAKPHCSVDDPDIIAAGTADNWNIRLHFQPAKSPDFNVLDLGFFASIQSLQYKETVKNPAELVDAVHKAFDTLSSKTLENTFLTLQKVLELAIASLGGNQFKLPHVGKEKLRRKNLLPDNLSCDKTIFLRGMMKLKKNGAR